MPNTAIHTKKIFSNETIWYAIVLSKINIIYICIKYIQILCSLSFGHNDLSIILKDVTIKNIPVPNVVLNDL